MPSRRPNPKPATVAAANGDLEALGFRVAQSGPHTSKTLMLQELEALLAAIPPDAPAKAYRTAIVDENVLGKRTLSTRKETATRLTALHGLDPSKPLFRVLRRLWAVDPAAHPQLALLLGKSCVDQAQVASRVAAHSTLCLVLHGRAVQASRHHALRCLRSCGSASLAH